MAKIVTQTGTVMDETIAGMDSVIEHIKGELDESENYDRSVVLRAVLSRAYRANSYLSEARAWYRNLEDGHDAGGGEE